MAKMYFNLIIAERKVFNDVPENLKEEVKVLLLEADREDLIKE